MHKLYLAKNNETIQQHTNKLLEEYNNFVTLYGDLLSEKDFYILKLACLYHDLGKINRIFQEKIRTKVTVTDEIPHGYLSCAFIDTSSEYFSNLDESDIRILYEIIFYHHYRGTVDINMRKNIRNYIKNYLKLDSDDFVYEYVKSPEKLNIDFIKSIKKRILHDENLSTTLEQRYVKLKGLLNKIDYAASAHIPVEIKAENLEALVFKSIKNFNPNEMQKFMLNNQNNNVIVIASTGMGKTEGSLLWIGENKGFFTLPLKVSINAIYDRIIKNVKYHREKVGLLHSDSASEYLKRDVYDEDYMTSTKQLTLPMTICTLDQLITFIFKFHNFEIFLATLSYSKIVIDEIQMYSPEMIAYLLIALKTIDNYNGKFAIVTATFPPIFSYFMDYLNISNYIKPKKEFLLSKKRHKMKVIERELTCGDIEQAYKENRVLVIVNTVKKAQELYTKLKENSDIEVHLFHSRFTKKDRANKERAIFEDGKITCSKKVIWITTQVVEASLDIDYDILLTELSDINGLFQRMGRCFRGRELLSDDCNVYIFAEASGINKNSRAVIDYDIYTHSKKAILKYDNQVITEELKMKIVEDVYSVDNLKNSDYFKKIKDTIDVFYNVKAFDLKKDDARLRDISSVTVIPRKLYTTDLIKKINDYKKESRFNQKLLLKNEILESSINVGDYFVKKDTEYIMLNSYEKIYIVDNKYSYELGLSTEKDIDNSYYFL